MDSPGGIVNARLRPDGLVSVAMGVPDFEPASLPFEAPAAAATYHLDTSAGPVEIGAVSIGNPHAVIRVRDVTRAPVDTVGPAVENHPRFPRRVNVGFLEIVAPDHVRLRVFERGVGETQACGTGACAAVAVGRRHGPLAEEVTVDVPGRPHDRALARARASRSGSPGRPKRLLKATSTWRAPEAPEHRE